LEQIQRNATKLVSHISALSYNQRLRKIGITTLEQRRIRGDLIEAYKIISGKERIDMNQFFTLNNNGHNTRGHTLKLAVQRSRLDIRKYFFSQRVVERWNGLPQHVISAESTNAFKARLDKHWDMGIKGSALTSAHHSTSTSTSRYGSFSQQADTDSD